MRRNPTIRSSPARGARERRRRRPGLDRLEARLTPTTIDPNAIPTVGVYDENTVNTNAVDFIATGSSVTGAQFAADVASAYAKDLGGVINGSVLGSLHSYGVDHNKMLTVSSPTNWGIGQGPARAAVRGPSRHPDPNPDCPGSTPPPPHGGGRGAPVRGAPAGGGGGGEPPGARRRRSPPGGWDPDPPPGQREARGSDPLPAV